MNFGGLILIYAIYFWYVQMIIGGILLIITRFTNLSLWYGGVILGLGIIGGIVRLIVGEFVIQ